MHVVTVGLSQRDEATFAFFLGRFKKGWTWQGAPADLAATLPAADIVMVELGALGMAHWSESAQAQLLQLVQGHPAVLVVPANDRTWTVLETEAKARSAPLILLPRPYGTEPMRAALEQAAAWVALQAKVTPPPSSAPAVTPAPVPSVAPAPVALSMGLFRPVVSVAAPVTTGVTVAGDVTGPDEPGLSPSQLQARLAAQPDHERHLFLRQLASMIELGQPFEARFTVQNSLIVHPAEGWAATNTPMMVIERVCKSDVMASAVNIREIDPSQADERAGRLRMPLRELESFLWELVNAAGLPG
jgi:hypothetical protein